LVTAQTRRTHQRLLSDRRACYIRPFVPCQALCAMVTAIN